jgi:hypothetical protein
MTGNVRPNLGGLFDGSTPADRISSIAGRLGPRLISAPVAPDVESPAIAATTPQTADVPRPTNDHWTGWIDPIRVLELYFGALQAALDANREFVMGLAGVVVSGGTRLRDGLGSSRTGSRTNRAGAAPMPDAGPPVPGAPAE